MSKQRKLKRKIRARMQETGERYTTARAAILAESYTPPPASSECENARASSTPRDAEPEWCADCAGTGKPQGVEGVCHWCSGTGSVASKEG